jgi:hypothetical protein
MMAQSIVVEVKPVAPAAGPGKRAPHAWAWADRYPPFLQGVGHAFVLAAVCGLLACKPTLVVGEFQCQGDGTDGGPSGDDPITVPWATGFEQGACDYLRVGGFCYQWPPITFRLVDSPVHSGRYAVEISVVTGTDGGSTPQGRCARQGVLPVEAYYGAWFLIPKAATNKGLWNLFHFRRDDPDGVKPGLWDVSLVNRSGELRLELYSSRFPVGSIETRLSPPVPIGRWFEVVVYLKRAKDATGAVALYLGEQKVVELTNLVTDDSDWGQWYVGNLSDATDPPENTVYLDDVTIRSSL